MRQRNHLGSIGRSSHYFSVLCVLFRKIFLSVGFYSASQEWLPPLGLSLDRKNQTAAAPIPTTNSAISMIDYLLQGLNAQGYEYSIELARIALRPTTSSETSLHQRTLSSYGTEI